MKTTLAAKLTIAALQRTGEESATIVEHRSATVSVYLKFFSLHFSNTHTPHYQIDVDE